MIMLQSGIMGVTFVLQMQRVLCVLWERLLHTVTSTTFAMSVCTHE